MTGDWSAVIINYNGDPYLGACLAALERVRLRPRDVFVVDNASTDDSMRELIAYPWAQALPQGNNLGFAGGANAGLERVETSYAVILNPDVELEPDFGDALVSAFGSNSRLGVAGSLLLYPDRKTVQHAGGIVYRPTMWTNHRGRGHPIGSEFEQEVDIDYAGGAGMGLRMSSVREVGGFDTIFSPVYYEDVDLCERIRKSGWDVRLIPSLRAIHHEGVTLGLSPEYYINIYVNRIRYALRYLSAEEWATEFVPHEYERIRHELATAGRIPASQRAGAEAIEMLLRDVPPFSPVTSALPLVRDFPDATIWIEELDRLREVKAPRVRSRVPLVGRLLDSVVDRGPRRYVDAALSEQREFNNAVIRAFETQQTLNTQQQQLNREQTAAVLILALTLIGRLHHLDSSEPSNQAGES